MRWPSTAGGMLTASAGFCYGRGWNETVASQLQGEFYLPQPVLWLCRKQTPSAALHGTGRALSGSALLTR